MPNSSDDKQHTKEPYRKPIAVSTTMFKNSTVSLLEIVYIDKNHEFNCKATAGQPSVNSATNGFRIALVSLFL